ncbi:MAG: histidine phosphotransferase family protein [Pseudomonadota bacterium]
MTDHLSQQHIEFAAQMCSRLCHDLISPVGALSNGLEILADETDPEMQGQVIEMLTQSARVTSAKLRFYRTAFGVTGGFDADVATRDLKGIAEDFIDAGKAQLDWQIIGSAMPKSHAKLLFIGLLTAADALVRGGNLVVTGDATTGYKVAATGEKVIVDEEVAALLASQIGPQHQVSRYAPLVLFLSLLPMAAVTHAFEHSPTEFVLTLTPL